MAEDVAGSSYTTYQIERVRCRDEGLCALPVAGPAPQAVAVARLYAPVEYEKVYWTAVRDGATPKVPSPELDNPNRLFMGGWQLNTTPVPVGTEGHSWGLAGLYLYCILAPEGLTSDFYSGRLPIDDGVTADKLYFPSGNFDTSLVSAQSSRPSSPAIPDLPPHGS